MNMYHYSKYLYKPKKGKKKLLIFLVVLMIIGGGIYSFLFIDIQSLYIKAVNIYRLLFNDYRFIEGYLEDGNYNLVIHEGLPFLEKRPLNDKLLRYIGEAYYFVSDGLSGEEQKKALFKSIQYIRKGLVLTELTTALRNSYYILGMAYFKLGFDYYELAAEYLRKAQENGFKNKNLYRIIGYCYYRLGIYKEAIDFLKVARKNSSDDLVRLYLALALKENEQYNSAYQELNSLISETADESIKKEALMALSWIEYDEERLDEAMSTVEKVLQIDNNNADAYYLLGNIYERKGDLISARKQWRTALKINPKHIGAIDKLY